MQGRIQALRRRRTRGRGTARSSRRGWRSSCCASCAGSRPSRFRRSPMLADSLAEAVHRVGGIVVVVGDGDEALPAFAADAVVSTGATSAFHGTEPRRAAAPRGPHRPAARRLGPRRARALDDARRERPRLRVPAGRGRVRRDRPGSRRGRASAWSCTRAGSSARTPRRGDVLAASRTRPPPAAPRPRATRSTR